MWYETMGSTKGRCLIRKELQQETFLAPAEPRPASTPPLAFLAVPQPALDRLAPVIAAQLSLIWDDWAKQE